MAGERIAQRPQSAIGCGADSFGKKLQRANYAGLLSEKTDTVGHVQLTRRSGAGLCPSNMAMTSSAIGE